MYIPWGYANVVRVACSFRNQKELALSLQKGLTILILYSLCPKNSYLALLQIFLFPLCYTPLVPQALVRLLLTLLSIRPLYLQNLFKCVNTMFSLRKIRCRDNTLCSTTVTTTKRLYEHVISAAHNLEQINPNI